MISPCIPPTPRPSVFFFNDTATTEIYTLSLHDALPIYAVGVVVAQRVDREERDAPRHGTGGDDAGRGEGLGRDVEHFDPAQRVVGGGQLRPVHVVDRVGDVRSEEHTAELQSPCNIVWRLLLVKKKTKHTV